MYLELVIDDGFVILSHPAGATGMVNRAGDLANKGADILIRGDVGARADLAKDKGTVGLGGDDLPAHVEGCYRAAHVVVLGVAQVVGKDFGFGAAGAVGELDLAAALGPAHTKIEAEARPAVETQGEMLG